MILLLAKPSSRLNHLPLYLDLFLTGWFLPEQVLRHRGDGAGGVRDAGGAAGEGCARQADEAAPEGDGGDTLCATYAIMRKLPTS